MKIAVTSQNRTSITGTRWQMPQVLGLRGGQSPGQRQTTAGTPLEQSFHESAHAPDPQAPHPLDGVSLLITASAGVGLKARLRQKGMAVCVTSETDPDHAVAAWLQGTLPEVASAPQDCDCGHNHDHAHPV